MYVPSYIEVLGCNDVPCLELVCSSHLSMRIIDLGYDVLIELNACVCVYVRVHNALLCLVCMRTVHIPR